MSASEANANASASACASATLPGVIVVHFPYCCQQPPSGPKIGQRVVELVLVLPLALKLEERLPIHAADEVQRSDYLLIAILTHFRRLNEQVQYRAKTHAHVLIPPHVLRSTHTFKNLPDVFLAHKMEYYGQRDQEG